MQRNGIRPTVGGVEVDVPLGTFVGGQFLRYNATTGQIDTAAAGGGGGITGPGAAAVGDVVTWNNVGGTAVADAGFLASDVVRAAGGAVTATDIAVYSGAGGRLIADSGVTLARMVRTNGGSYVIGNVPVFQTSSGNQLADIGIVGTSVVQGPVSAVVGRLATFSSTLGNAIQDSGFSLAGNAVIRAMQLSATSRTTPGFWAQLAINVPSAGNWTFLYRGSVEGFINPTTLAWSATVSAGTVSRYSFQYIQSVTGSSASYSATLTNAAFGTPTTLTSPGVDFPFTCWGSFTCTAAGTLNLGVNVTAGGSVIMNAGSIGELYTADSSPAISGGGGSISGPGSSVVGDVVLWNNTVGTLVADTGIVGSQLVRNPSLISNANDLAIFNSTGGIVINSSGLSYLDVVQRPLTGAVVGNVPVFNDPTGNLLADSGKALSSYLPAFLVSQTFYVDAATGSDFAAGTIGAPWQTLARAWTERLKYGVILATFTIQLIGSSTYTAPFMGASVCGSGGNFIIRGDTAADVVSYSGSFTSAFGVGTGLATTTAGLGIDTKRGQFVRVTSGASIGAVFIIQTHTDTSLTVCYSQLAVAPGDTFDVFAPGTGITFVAAGSGQPPACPTDWVGGFASQGLTNAPPQHILFDLRVVGQSAVINATLAFVQCRSGGFMKFTSSDVMLGNFQNGFILGVGANTATNLLAGAGLSSLLAGGSGYTVDGGSTIVGTMWLQALPITIGSNSATDTVILNGCRFDGLVTVQNGSYLELFGGLCLFKRQISAIRGGRVRLAGTTNAVFALTLASCLAASYDGQIYVETSVTGGTSAATGYGSDARAGGSIFWKNIAPTLTGGTAGQDLAVDGATAANATLAATPSGLLSTLSRSAVVRVT